MNTPIQPRNFQLVPNAPVKSVSPHVIIDDDDVQPPLARALARAFATSALFVTDEVIIDKSCRVDVGR
jgi:hypothetical protein